MFVRVVGRAPLLTPPGEGNILKKMADLRPVLHFALALILTSLTCGVGALCAGMDEECCCMTEDGSSPCTEVSGGNDAPVTPEPASTLESGERFSVAIVEAAPIGTSAGNSESSRGGRAAQAPAAAATPLYLSHCAFLC